MIFLLGEEAIPKRAGYTGSRPTTGAIHANTTITAVYTKDSGIVIPTQPTGPGEIMSGGEGEPVENEPIEEETVSPQGTHVTGTQTVTHEYLTLNGKVARETIKTNDSVTAVLDFIYDESGKPFALKYSTNGTSFQTYYYVLNLQGDVVKLIHYIPGFEYESVATYEYDAWGNIVSSSGKLAEINPLRYRGYYYDNETGFYYLQSRYYDPANRRFINADSLSSTGQGFLGTNMFAYCNNCPTIYHDPSGHAISPLTNNRTAIREGDYGKSNKRPGPRSNAARDELISYFESLTPAYNIEDYYGVPSNINITVEYDGIYEKRSRVAGDLAVMVVGVAASILSHIWGPAAIIGEIATYVGAVSTVTGLADSLPEGDYDAYVVTITWDIPYVELPSSNNTPRLIGYSAQYYMVYCDSYREPFWCMLDYSLTEIYG